MGRLTQMINYLNSDAKDWQTTGGISYSDFTHFNISEESKKFRRWYKYSKQEEYVK